MWIEVHRAYTDHKGEQHVAKTYVNTDHIRYIGDRGEGGVVITWAMSGLTPISVTESYAVIISKLGRP